MCDWTSKWVRQENSALRSQLLTLGWRPSQVAYAEAGRHSRGMWFAPGSKFLEGRELKWKLVNANVHSESLFQHTKCPPEKSYLVICKNNKFPLPAARCCLLWGEKCV